MGNLLPTNPLINETVWWAEATHLAGFDHIGLFMSRATSTTRIAIAFAAVILHNVAQATEPLANLDKIGREIAVHPCKKPHTTFVTRTNVHDETVRDQYVTQRCNRVASEVLRSSVSNYQTTIPLSARTDQIDYRLPPRFRVGQPISKIKGLLGAPETERGESLTYLLPSETREETVSFVHKRGRVTSVVWAWYFD